MANQRPYWYAMLTDVSCELQRDGEYPPGANPLGSNPPFPPGGNNFNPPSPKFVGLILHSFAWIPACLDLDMLSTLLLQNARKKAVTTGDCVH